MSKKDQLHEWIESGDEEEKARVLSRIKGELAKEAPPKVAHKKLSFKKIASIAAAAVVTLGVGIFSAIYFSRQGGKPAPKDENRYCASSEYSGTVMENFTLKNYGEQLGKDLLYFDWYDKADELVSTQYFLNGTAESVGFSELLINGETGDYVTLYVTDNKTELEELNSYKKECSKQYIISNVKIWYIYGSSVGYIRWEYKNYCYYLRVDMPQSEQAMFALVEELLSA